jgi:hypothetical protein
MASVTDLCLSILVQALLSNAGPQAPEPAVAHALLLYLTRVGQQGGISAGDDNGGDSLAALLRQLRRCGPGVALYAWARLLEVLQPMSAPGVYWCYCGHLALQSGIPQPHWPAIGGT